VKSIPESKTISYHPLNPDKSSSIIIVEGDYVLRANVKNLTASITIKYEVVNDKDKNDAKKEDADYAERLVTKGAIQKETPIIRMARGYTALIPLDEDGAPIVVTTVPDNDGCFKNDDINYCKFLQNGDVGDFYQAIFTIKLKDKRSLATLITMDTFKTENHWEARRMPNNDSGIGQFEKEGYKAYLWH
jgi:hypothetical protein